MARKRQRRRETSEEALGEQAATAPDDVEEDFARRELSQAALEALGQLSDIDRETLLGTFWEQAAANAPTAGSRGQGPSAAAVRKRRERALTRLRSAFWRLYGLD